VDLYIHSTLSLFGVVLNWLSTGQFYIEADEVMLIIFHSGSFHKRKFGSIIIFESKVLKNITITGLLGCNAVESGSYLQKFWGEPTGFIMVI
jgi:hypothetical protein